MKSLHEGLNLISSNFVFEPTSQCRLVDFKQDEISSLKESFTVEEAGSYTVIRCKDKFPSRSVEYSTTWTSFSVGLSKFVTQSKAYGFHKSTA